MLYFRPILIILFFGSAHMLFAQQFNSGTEEEKVSISYGKKGFSFETSDQRFLLQIQSRLQFRYATPGDQDPLTLNDFTDDRTNVFKINRARLKIGGHAFKPWLKYYWEYELRNSNLLDFRLMIERWEWLNLKVGQWKVEFTRERRISSGGQQLVDRSIVNRPFTVDRQQGVELYGRLNGNGSADFNYWMAVLTGTGRGNTDNDDNHLMYFGRVQWNVLGRVLDFKASDLERHEEFTPIIALAAVTNRSPYTRFSQGGGGDLEGFEDGEAGQYRVSQANLETAFMWQGISWASEVHGKWITDKLDGDERYSLYGYYVQAGYFFHEILDWWPEPMELAIRHSEYYPSETRIANEGEETSVAVNWFFNGHNNKLTAEVSRFEYEQTTDVLLDDWRFRIQWDISF